MFLVAVDENKGLASTPTIWFKTVNGVTGYYWPLYGLHFKIKNYVPLPIDLQELKKEWRFVPCTILLNGEKFRTYQDAEKALAQVLKENEEGNEESDNEQDEDESNKEKSGNEESDDEESLVLVSDDDEAEKNESVVVEPIVDEVQTNESDEVNSVVVLSDDEAADQQGSETNEEDESVVNESDEVSSVMVPSDDEEADQQGSEQNEDEPEPDEESSDEDDESFGFLPIKEPKYFKANEAILKKRQELAQLKRFYLKINENSERPFFNECVKKSFEENFFLNEITFKPDAKRKDWLGVFDETLLYKCLKKAVVKKLKLSLTDSELKKMFVTNFERIKRAIRARP